MPRCDWLSTPTTPKRPPPDLEASLAASAREHGGTSPTLRVHIRDSYAAPRLSMDGLLDEEVVSATYGLAGVPPLHQVEQQRLDPLLRPQAQRLRVHDGQPVAREVRKPRSSRGDRRNAGPAQGRG